MLRPLRIEYPGAWYHGQGGLGDLYFSLHGPNLALHATGRPFPVIGFKVDVDAVTVFFEYLLTRYRSDSAFAPVLSGRRKWAR